MSKRILVIDDTLAVCRMYLRLQSDKIEVVCAQDHDQALQCINQGGWDIVLMDGSLNPRDGQLDTDWLVERLKEKGHKGPIIANSARLNTILLEVGCTAASQNDQKMTPQALEMLIASL